MLAYTLHVSCTALASRLLDLKHPLHLFFPCRYREAYLRLRYTTLWLTYRGMRTFEPLSAAITCAWLAYGSWEKAVAHTTEAAIMGALLALIFFSSVASLCAGLRFGRAWRELPRGVP